jgi:hypothetical protein
VRSRTSADWRISWYSRSFGHGAVAVRVDVGAVIVARQRSVEPHAKPHGFAIRTRAEHEMQVARLEVERESALRGVPRRLLLATVQLPPSAHSFRTSFCGTV